MKILCSSGKRSGSLRTRVSSSSRSSITSAYRDDRLPGLGDFDPPEYDEPDEISSLAEVEIEIDAEVEVASDGEFIFVDEEVPWAFNPDDNSGDWYDEATGAYLGDGADMADRVQDVISPRIPAKPGTYHVTGIVLLVFNISGISRYNVGTHDDPDYSDDINGADVQFDFGASEIESLTVK